jgi:hypothetical protein
MPDRDRPSKPGGPADHRPEVQRLWVAAACVSTGLKQKNKKNGAQIRFFLAVPITAHYRPLRPLCAHYAHYVLIMPIMAHYAH